MSAITDLSAAGLAAAIRKKDVSATEAMTATIAAAKAAHAKLNCFIRIDEDAALAEARAADADLARGVLRGALHGVPMAHKDMYYRAGIASSCGSKITRDRIPTTTASALKRLDAAGAIQFGVLTMTEFAYGPLGHNYHWGHTRNAWNPEYVTGGSSSGSGTSVAARANFLALGSDTGGSIRLPAAFCGVAGLKPTYGRVSRAGAMPLSFTLDHVGPLARTVEDCALALQAIAGHDAADPYSSPNAVPDYLAALARPVKGLRVGVPKNYFHDDIDADVGKLMEESLAVFRSLGCEVVPVTLPDMESWNAAATCIIAAEAASLHSTWLRERPQDYSDQVRARLELGVAVSAVQYVNALRLRGAALEQWLREVMSQVDVVHAPVFGFRTPTLAETDVGGGERMTKTLALATRLTRPGNYLGVPSLVVPCGFQPHGLPAGFQLMGRPFEESTVLALGHAYEHAAGWTGRKPA